MNRAFGLVVFLGIVLAVLFGIHFFLWARLVRDPAWPRPLSVIGSLALLTAAVSIPTNLLLNRSRPMALPWLIWPAYIWLGLMFLLFVVLLGFDVVRLILWLLAKNARAAVSGEAADLGRRVLLARFAAGGAALLASGLGWVALRSALGPVGVRRVEVRLPRLRPEHDGLTIVQLTDLHVGPTIGAHQIDALVARSNALRPDIVAITGDLVDGGVAELGPAVASLARLEARHGVFFVTGNHEYYSGVTEWLAELGRLGIRVLRNERVPIGGGDGGGVALELAGVDDHSAARSAIPGHGEDVSRAVAGWSRQAPLVLLAHQPRTIVEAARLGVDLQLSGHTHGGQIWPFGALVRLQQQFIAGLGRLGETFIYVSRGTGYWGPPMRLGAPAEIAQIVLRPGEPPGRGARAS